MRHVFQNIWIFGFLLFVSSASFAGTIYTRDNVYFYAKTPLKLSFDGNQRGAITAAIAQFNQSMDTLVAKYPDVLAKVGDVGTLQSATENFDRELDQVVKFLDRRFSKTAKANRIQVSSLMPTGMMFFVGTGMQAGAVVKGGGSLMFGVVLVLYKVRRIELATRAVTEYLEVDSEIFGWPNANIGVGTTPGLSADQRIGLGLIWGALDQAKDFNGLVIGASGSGKIKGISILGKYGVNMKLLALKNWSKQGAISNVFWTTSLDRIKEVAAAPAGVEAHVSFSYLVSGQAAMSLFTGGGTPMDGGGSMPYPTPSFDPFPSGPQTSPQTPTEVPTTPQWPQYPQTGPQQPLPQGPQVRVMSPFDEMLLHPNLR